MEWEQREGRYRRIHAQLRELIEGASPGLIPAMATVCAVLHHKMPHHSWTGFYLVADCGELHVGPYQGPVACQVLKGGGVCLHCVETGQPVVVPDVGAFPGHIACDPSAQSEIVLPLSKQGRVLAVLDIDAHQPDVFSERDIGPLQEILALLDPFLEIPPPA